MIDEELIADLERAAEIDVVASACIDNALIVARMTHSSCDACVWLAFTCAVGAAALGQIGLGALVSMALAMCWASIKLSMQMMRRVVLHEPRVIAMRVRRGVVVD